MPSFRTAVVTEVLAEREGLQRVAVGDERAYVLTQLTGPVAAGDEVVLNTTAVELGLGTGGWHVVHWNLARGAWSHPGPGHIMKLRYTSLQADTGAAEEHHPDLPEDLGGRPVVACGVHSQVAAVAVAAKAARPAVRLVYVMTDGAALPLALSDLVHELCQLELVDATVTAGHAFGGDLEAVSVPSALALAVHVLAADVVVVGMGPGVVGTATGLGTTGVEVAPVLDAAAALGGVPLICLRLSSADGRDRHRGLSHHSRTALDLVRSSVRVPVPADAVDLVAGLDERHQLQPVETPDVGAQLAERGLVVTTMGRGPAEDPAFFAACGAAGVAAAELVRR